MIGTSIGRYRILAKLGEGGMGTVWKAQHTLLPDRIVALKLLSEGLWESDEARQRFLREAIAVSRLDHPMIATLYDAEHADGRLHIAFKFIDGDTVAQKTASGPLMLSEALAIAADAAAALAHAHARGVLHRDVSAGNIMVDREGRGVLVDFGLARSATDATMTRTGTTQGTLAYMAPEVLRGESADARADLYGLGAVLYRMVTGRPLFEADSTETLQFKVLNEEPRAPSQFRPGTPPALDGLILKLLEKQPGDRYPSAEALLAAVRNVQQLSAIRAERTDAVPAHWWLRWPRTWRRMVRRRRSRWALGVGGLVALVALGTGVAWVRGWRPGFMTPEVPVLAVLPPRNTSRDLEETGYLAEGLGEELGSRLGRLDGIRVLPWITTQRFVPDSARSLTQIAQELRANVLLACTYRSDGERIRVNVALVDGRNGTQRWSNVFEENVEDLFAVQRNVALGVASALKRQLSGEERQMLANAPSPSPEAYDFFIRGANYVHAQEQQSAELFFKKALELDPNLAEAWVGIGAIHIDRQFRGVAGDAELAEGERFFRRALALRPGLATAEIGLIQIYSERGQNEDAFEVGVAAARRAPDDVEALMAQSWAYTLGGLPKKALPVLARILELDPANQPAAFYRVIAAQWSGQEEEAVEYAKTYVRRFGEDPEVYTWAAAACDCQGKLREARLYYERALQLFGEEQSNLYVVPMVVDFYLRIGERDRARDLASRWVDILDRRVAASPDNARAQDWLAALNSLLNRKEEVERWAARAMADAREGKFAANGLMPVFESLARVGSLEMASETLGLMHDPRNAISQSYLSPCQKWPSAFQSDPGLQSFVATMRKRLDELAAKY